MTPKIMEEIPLKLSLQTAIAEKSADSHVDCGFVAEPKIKSRLAEREAALERIR